MHLPEDEEFENLLKNGDLEDKTVNNFDESDEIKDAKIPMLAVGQNRPNKMTLWVKASDISPEKAAGKYLEMEYEYILKKPNYQPVYS